ncbi:hypothetical protein CBS101457_005658 [Exobasidium rhododendri]|nr:hypothetical protein CBS101457_005658 [Exobasidium rhododendri]
MRRAANISAATTSNRKGSKRRISTATSASSRLDPSDEDSGRESERDPLLDPESNADAHLKDLPKRCSRESIFPLLHVIRQDVRSTIDTHLDWSELTSLDLNYSIVRPLALKYSQYENLSILFILLVNRIQFQRDADRDLALQNVNQTRASLCELLAMKLLRTFSRNGLELITALTYPFSPFQGADESMIASEGLDPDDVTRPGQTSSVLELAIFSKAKKFIKAPLCQRCIAGIYEGRIVLSYQSTHAILDDSYKKRPLGIYDPAKAPFLDHYRLRVPMIRNRIEFINFCILLIFYVWCLSSKGSPTWTTAETVFVVWLFGFALDEFAQLQEHGIGIYSTSLYNLLDFVFCAIGLIWLGLRISSLVHHLPERSNLSFDVLAIGAILLCPRVASVLVQDNVVLLALKAMLADFCFFMALAVVCFSGFLYTFYSLSGPEWTAGKIVWIMMKVWFGNSYVGFDTAQSFSPIFGPTLMVLFAVMANTLLLTILISLLSNTFSTVAQNASEEAMYQHACLTLSGISTDALFSYMPPLNLVAFVVILPASFVLNPRWLHKTNIALLRATSWPLLVVIRMCSFDIKSHSYLASSSIYMESRAEKASQFISWIPIPRSRSNPDRDIIEAAFNQADAKNLSPDQWEEWTASMIQIRDRGSGGGKDKSRRRQANKTQRNEDEEDEDGSTSTEEQSTVHDQKHGSTATSSVKRGKSARDWHDTEEEDDNDEVQHYETSNQLTMESPLAKIFGRARHSSAERSVLDSHKTPKRKASEAQSKTKQGEQKELSAKFQSEIETLAEKNETASLIRSLMEKMEEHEKAQKRIEELLQAIIDKEN